MTQRRAHSKPRRICIVGGGAGGIELATRLGRRLGGKGKAEIILVDRNAQHVWKPRLHEVAAGLMDADDAVGYLGHSASHGYQFHLGTLLGIDPVRHSIRFSGVQSKVDGCEILGERAISYDFLVLALGSRANDFGISGVAEHCHMLDSAAQAADFQRRFLEGVFQVAEGRKDRLGIGIVGAGSTGVELAAELRHAAHDLRRFGGLDDQQRLDITLVDGADRILPAVDQKTSDEICKSLQQFGVAMQLGHQVDHVTADALHLQGGRSVPCDLKVWASGIVIPDLSKILPALTLLKAGRIKVDDHLACAGVADIFAIGDCASVESDAGTLPPTAQVAHQQAGYLANALSRRLLHRPVGAFRYRARGTLISLGGKQAVGEIPLAHRKAPVTISGIKTKLLYVALYQMHRAVLFGWPRTVALIVADWLRRRTLPPIKLHW
jgi:NADH dehydrogenase